MRHHSINPSSAHVESEPIFDLPTPISQTGFANCCAPPRKLSGFGAEQNPQVPLASEDASFRQVPGNAETAVGVIFLTRIARLISGGGYPEDRQTILDASRTTHHAPKMKSKASNTNQMKPRNQTPPYELNNSGARALLCAVIEQAVTDFKTLTAAGRIVNGKVMPVNRARVLNYRTDAEVQSLVDFFTSGVMDEWIFLAGIRINPNLIREKLGIPKETSNPHPAAPQIQ
jgi:hypothetical protein